MRYAYTSTSLKTTSRSLPCQNYSRKIIATNLYSIDYQILIEADYIVNAVENEYSNFRL